MDADEEIMLDANLRAEGHQFYSVRGLEVSSGNNILAFAEDTVGRRIYTLRFLDLESNEEFWRFLGERAQTDLIVTGSLDFDIQDRSGYRTEEYVSPFDSRTYYRQVLVESTGYEYDIVMQVYDGRSGEQLYSDNFKDFRQFEADRADPLAGMFENLYALEDRIAGIFTQKWVVAERVLYTD